MFWALLDAPLRLPYRQLSASLRSGWPSEFEALTDVGLVAHMLAGYRPTFLAVAATEVASVAKRAETGATQAAFLYANWPDLLAAVSDLKVRTGRFPNAPSSWSATSCLIRVHSRCSDNGELMPPAPARRERAGIEGTLSQGIRASGLRQTRYRGLAKTSLQNTAIGAAINVVRVVDWLNGKPQAATRQARFARLAA